MCIKLNSLFVAVLFILLLNYVNSLLEDVGKNGEDCSSSTDFRCKDGKCIKKAYVCNNLNDCSTGDNSDEEDCGK